ncbi:coiled-coil domain-containing protein 83-like [Styela clava]
MGKKGGKKKGKGKKSGGGKKGKKSGQREDEMTLQEAVLAFQIQVKEKAVEDLMFEIKGLQEKNKRHQARNTRLKEEQDIHIKVLLRQAKEQETEQDSKESFTCEHVEKAMRQVWWLSRTEEQQLKNLETKINGIDKEYSNVWEQVEMWRAYRDSGAKQHADQIQVLELELEDMKRSFEDICAHLKRQLHNAKSEVKSYMDQCMAEQQHLASEKAMEQMDKIGVQEIHENEWLKTEAEIHRKEVASLYSIVETLEHENIQLICELIDCQAEDLKISRTFANVGFEGEETDAMDRKQMSIYEPGYKSPTGTPTRRAITPGKERPRSAMQAAIEDRVFSIKFADDSSEGEESEDEENKLALHVDVENKLALHVDDEDNILSQQEYLHLGPLELKLLCVRGEPKPIHEIDAGIQIVDGTSSDLTVTRPRWPVSPPMIRKAVETP